MPTLTFTGSQHRLLLPDEVKERAVPWVRVQTTTSYRDADQAPFRRMIDFWFTAVGWAVRNGIEPVERASGRMFVNLGPNPNDIRNFEEWRADLLVVVATRDFGVESPDLVDTRRVIDLANRYAEAGSRSLLDTLEQRTDLALPRLYVVAELFAELVRDARADREGASF